MTLSFQRSCFLATAFGLVAGVMPLGAEEVAKDVKTQIERLERENRILKRQNAALQKSLVAANMSETQSATALAQIKSRLEALGRNIFDSQDERLIEALASVEFLSTRVNELETASVNLAASVQDYLTTAVASNPESRVKVEESIRVLDSALGLRNKPRPKTTAGTLQSAEVVSIDGESGMLVLNIGKDVGTSIGMTFSILRGDQSLGEATIVDTRSAVSGAFVDTLNDTKIPVRLGDILSLNTEAK